MAYFTQFAKLLLEGT